MTPRLSLVAHDLTRKPASTFRDHAPAASDFAARESLDGPNFGDVRHEMAQQILDAVLERRGGRRTAGARALHRQIDHAVLVAAERDVAAIVRDRRAYARLDQLLD